MNIASLWSLDILGIRDPIAIKSKDVVDAETLSNISNRYEVELPWVEDGPKFLGNRESAEKRLIFTTKKLISLNQFVEYSKIFEDWKTSGIIEEVQNDDRNISGHFLPHHPVFKVSSSTTKIRPVFDASAKSRDGMSLINCLVKGPNSIVDTQYYHEVQSRINWSNFRYKKSISPDQLSNQR
ncbi:uncharacterized protein [Leptinotarsa decemlineata]|uniref:uncharacterized protein n=1 Tax=Leptinotarsa decemlineata TaxID=7539 RepID=UPI003D3043E8